MVTYFTRLFYLLHAKNGAPGDLLREGERRGVYLVNYGIVLKIVLGLPFLSLCLQCLSHQLQ